MMHYSANAGRVGRLAATLARSIVIIALTLGAVAGLGVSDMPQGTQLAFTVEPAASTLPGDPLANVVVQIQDSTGNGGTNSAASC
jgi:hypothetical protein